ncbi:MAG: 4-alpha-glucanotransferase [Ignavibacteriae bacterium]|nr:4-alpha-glucanotransferase [Ignavibacteriota bacterium]
MNQIDYSHFLNTGTADKWKRIGLKRRAGVIAPLFSIYSKKSIGIGEIPDLKLLVKWCKKTELSIIQLLPMNDVGYDFAPYNSVSSFALEPMYLSINDLKDVNLNLFKKEIRDLKKVIPSGGDRANYKIKNEKIKLLFKIFRISYISRLKKFEEFREKNNYWLKDYVLYKVIKELQQNKSWESWEEKYRDRDEHALAEIEKDFSERINFYCWVEWQLYEQFKAVKKYANERDVLIMGDLPFLVSRDSADVWSHRNYFKLDFSSGAPPDMYFASGQRWGMPTYNREEMQKDNHEYIIQKLRYAENFYDMYRIDHFVGFFRLWSIAMECPIEEGGMKGAYDPADESRWEETGKRLLDVIVQNSTMMPCAEDLGTVPWCSPKTLWDYGITGMNVQRWVKDFGSTEEFIKPEHYRINSVATLSTHDSSTIIDWWHNETGTIDGKLFERLCESRGIKDENYNTVARKLFDVEKSKYGRLFWKNEIYNADIVVQALGLNPESCGDIINLYKESYDERIKFLNFLGLEHNGNDLKINSSFVRKALEKVNESASIFSIQLLQEWLFLDNSLFIKGEETSYRINFPGIVNDSNWSFVLPVSLDIILNLGVNSEIKKIVEETGRV